MHSRDRLSSRCSQYCFSGFGTCGVFFQREHRPIWGCPGEAGPWASVNPRPPTVALLLEAQLPRHPCQHPRRSLGSLSLGSHRGRASTFCPSSCGPVEFGAVSTLSLVNLHYTEVILMYSYTVCWYATVQAE